VLSCPCTRRLPIAAKYLAVAAILVAPMESLATTMTWFQVSIPSGNVDTVVNSLTFPTRRAISWHDPVPGSKRGATQSALVFCIHTTQRSPNRKKSMHLVSVFYMCTRSSPKKIPKLRARPMIPSWECQW
jgi:hypothetical protein